MLHGLPNLYENMYVVRSDGFRTDHEMTLLLLAGTSVAGEEFAESFPAWNKVVACAFVE